VKNESNLVLAPVWLRFKKVGLFRTSGSCLRKTTFAGGDARDC
jgi:hypothetical protein